MKHTSKSPTTAEQPFSLYQAYLWMVGNNVHICAFTSRRLSRADFDELTDQALDAVPNARMAVDADRQVFIPGVEEAPENRVFEKRDRLEIALPHWLHAGNGRFDHSTRPAFAAHGIGADEPDARGMRSVFYMQTSHALAEGLDVARLVRGRDERSRAPKTVEARLPALRRAGYAAAAALLGPLYLLVANLVPPSKDPGGFYGMALSRSDLRNAARAIGVSQRTLAFALVLHALQGDRRRNRFTYVTLPEARLDSEDDENLFFHLQSASVKPDPDFRTYARSLEAELARRDSSGLRMQYVYLRIGRMFRAIRRIAPFLFGYRYRRFVPTDFVLSMTPPVVPAGRFSDLVDGPIFCGAVLNGGNDCIITPQRDIMTFNFWLDVHHAGRLPRLAALARDLGIALDGNWNEVSPSPARQTASWSPLPS